jgi:hypothetical protein
MSIYRNLNEDLFSDYDVRRLTRQQKTAPPREAQVATRGPSTGQPVQNWQRKAQPAEIALPHAKRWLASLPEQVQPSALMAQFPRIANLIAAAWDDPESLHPYLRDLLTDQRGNRQGLPAQVVLELVALRDHLHGLHPSTIATWERASSRR